MSGLEKYILSVICVSLISGILLSLAGEGGAKEGIKFLCGVFLTLTVAAPLADFDIDHAMELALPDASDAEVLAASGENLARQARAELIKQRTETYILDKAGSLRGELTVEVTLSNAPVPIPAAVTLEGRVSPYTKSILEAMIHTDLGIPKENLRWSG